MQIYGVNTAWQFLNSIIYNTRVEKIARSLSKKRSVAVLGWNREGLDKKAVSNYIVQLKLLNIKAPYGKLYLLAYYPIYWIWILGQLLFKFKPRAAHACDLDSAIPAYLYKIMSGNKLVFDVCDRYAMTYISKKFRILYYVVNSLEDSIAKKSDVLINVSGRLAETFKKKPKLCAIIMNCPEDRTTGGEILLENKDNDNLKLVYTGIILRTRGLKEISLALRDLEGVQFDIAGRIVHKELLDEILQAPNIKYHGSFRPGSISALQASSDVMMALHDFTGPIGSFSDIIVGNKTFEAMMYGLPIITNIGSELIREARCGIMVNYKDVGQIKNAIVNLRDDVDLRRRLGKNGRQAFLERYNWKLMENELFKVYDKLMKSK